MSRSLTSTTGGGVLLAIHSILVARKELHLEANGEMICASVYIRSYPTLYHGAFYRPHHGISLLDKQCLNELDLSISRLPSNCHIILAGDFNFPDVDWSMKFVSAQCCYSTLCNQLINITQDYDLHQVVTSPTRENNIFDLVFTNVPFLVQNASILPGLSDHDIVSVEILISPVRIKQPHIKIFLYEKGKFDLINEDLAEYCSSILNDMLESLSVNDLWMNFKHVLSTTIKKHIPTNMISLNANIQWFRQAHKRAARHKHRANDKAKSTNAPGDWEVYSKLKHSLDHSLGNCRSVHLKAISVNLMAINSKPFWKFIKSLRHSSTGVLSLNAINGTATSTIDNADALDNQFQSVFTKEDCSNLPTLNSSPTKSMIPIQMSTDGIVKLWKELELQKAPDGPDCTTATILKTCVEQVVPLPQQIFHKALDTGELPLDWQKVNVSPIFKIGNISHPANYRPVSLTSIPCNIIHTNIMRHLEKYKVLNDEQRGFR